MSESSERSEELDVDRVEDCCNLDPEEIEADDVESEDSDDNDSDGAENDDEETGDPLDEEGDIAADYLEELLDIADLDGDIDTYVERPSPRFHRHGFADPSWQRWQGSGGFARVVAAGRYD